MTALLDTLTDEQRAAAETDLKQAIVVAGPGSGKSRVLAARVEYLLEHGVDPEQVRVFTFTRSACEEIRSRIPNQSVDVTTFHAFAARYVLTNGERVATPAENEAAIKSIYEGPTRRPSRGFVGVKTLRQEIRDHEALSRLRVSDHAYGPRTVKLVLSRLAERRTLPTWDLVPELYRSCPDAEGSGLFVDHVLTDEAHDATRLESWLATRGHNVFQVGDPRQAIMGWRGADEFEVEGDFGLTQTFRFGPAIADIANRVADRFLGGFIEGNESIESIESEVAIGESVPHAAGWTFPGETAVLCRTNHGCERVARELDGLGHHVRRDPNDGLALEADRFEQVARSGQVAITTIHSAKGREWDHVIVVDDDRWPRDEPEELRVLYVACTRARKRLTLAPRVHDFILGDAT